MWIIYALLVALFNTARSVASKKSLRSLDEYVVGWVVHGLPALLLLPAVLWMGMPTLGPTFFPVLLLDCLLSVVATVWSTRALLGDISLVMPMTAFTPLFMLLTSFVMLGEFPDAGGLLGVVLIVSGTYCLNLRERKNGWKEPWRALSRESGSRLMLGAAFIWSITANMDKMATLQSSPLFFVFAEDVVMALMLLPFAFGRLRRQKRGVRREAFHLVSVGAFSALALVFQMIAIQMTLAVYVVAVKRLSIFFSIILGGVLFKERDIRMRLAGGAIMVLGVLLITIF